MNNLSRYILGAITIAVIGFIAWYFSSVLIYILIAGVISLIGNPITNIISKLQIKNFKLPRWIAAILTLVLILSLFCGLFFFFTPLISTIATQIHSLDVNQITSNISGPLLDLNEFLRKTVPSLGSDFRLEIFAISQIKGMVDISMFSNILGSITSIIIDFAIAIFSITFISFFFLVEENLFRKIILAFFPDRFEKKINEASSDIAHLLTRYFLGISAESLGITLLNTFWLVVICKVDFSIGVVIALVSGILNVIPYVGPLCGHVIAVFMGLFIYGDSASSLSLGAFLLLILSLFLITQLIDNYIFQPLIYSNSVKAHPLEIFIVILIAGNLGGVIGMLIAIPSYTVIRVIAAQFLSQFKLVRLLTENMNPDNDEEKEGD